MSPENLVALAATFMVLAGQGAIWYKLGKLESKVDLHVNNHQEDHDGRRPRPPDPDAD